MRETVFINLTPHAIKVQKGDIEKVIEPSGKVARLSTAQRNIGAVDIEDMEDIPILKTFYDGIVVDGKEITNHAEVIYALSLYHDTFYILIVSLPTLMGIAKSDIPIFGENYMFVAPDTNNAIRDDKGKILAVKQFITL